MKKYYKFRADDGRLYARYEASKLGKTRLSKDGKTLRVFNDDGLDCTMHLQECAYGQKFADNEVKEELSTKDVEYDESSVKFFGTDVEEIKDKKGSFKSFHIKSWIQTNGDKIYIDKKINELKHLYPNFISSKRIIRKEKKGKIKKATQWHCEVVEAGSNFINQEESHIIHKSIQNHVPFTLDHSHIFYYVHNNVFRDTQNDCLVYADLDNGRLIRMDLEKPNMENLQKWIKENIDAD